MEGAFLTITISIVVPLLLLVLWLFIMFFVLKKCIFSKRDLVGTDCEDSSVRSRADSVVCTSTADPAIVTSMEAPSYDNDDLYLTANSELRTLRPPPYSTLPRNSRRCVLPRNSFSQHNDDESNLGGCRYGYRLSSANFSPFTRDNVPFQSDVMQAVSLYCDRYIEDASYQSPPVYQSRENTENVVLIRNAPGEEHARTESPYYGCETWI